MFKKLMRVDQARDAARRWVIEKASRIPGFCGAYTAGSTNWLSDDAELSTASDLDIMVVLADQNHAERRQKFIYRDTFLEVSYLGKDQLQSPGQVLSDYHLAPRFRTTNILIDPSGHLAALLAIVRRDYAKREWVCKRCSNARNKVDYWERLVVFTDRGPRAGASIEEIARQALQEDFGGWSESHRLVANVDSIRREQEGDRSRRHPLDVMIARFGAT